jgi:6-phosphogluconate dehydrogenase
MTQGWSKEKLQMQIAMVGLGKMGANMVRRLMKAGHECVVFDRSPEAVQALVKEGARGVGSIQELSKALKAPRTAWVMVPAGAATESTVLELAEVFEAGDAIIDGGNSFFKDDIRRAGKLLEKAIAYLDVGTSGGVWGVERGYCLMIGGSNEAVRRLDPIFKTLAPGSEDQGPSTAEQGYLHCGPPGAGHFVKMIHNGIEYGLMQAYAEGFDIMKNAGKVDYSGTRFDLKIDEIAEVWRRGSVVSSWLLDLTAIALKEDASLKKFTGYVDDSGEGRWTVQTAIEQATPADVLTSALFTRFRSRQEHTFAEKILSAMRKQFGGHVEQVKK